MFNNAVKKLFRERYGYEFKDGDPSFNAGVFGINLELWRKGNYLDEALYWMKQVYYTTSLNSSYLVNRMLIVLYGILALSQ